MTQPNYFKALFGIYDHELYFLWDNKKMWTRGQANIITKKQEVNIWTQLINSEKGLAMKNRVANLANNFVK